MPQVIDVGRDFHPRLAHRNEFQGDGKFTAIEFRRRYLKELDNQEFWDNNPKKPFIEFDFTRVTKIGPSFANEAFAYFTKYAKPGVILDVIVINTPSNVQRTIIKEEIESGYKGK